MTKYLPLIVTSEIDKNYFIINNGIFYNSYLTELLKKQDIELAKIILSIKENPELLNQKIFVEKSTKLGIELEKLINKKQIISENQIIRESYLLNALVSAVLNKEEQEYINTIANLINKNYFNAIFYYDSPLLKKINFDGRKNNYFKKIEFNGFETNGIINVDDAWYYIDILSKQITPQDIIEDKKIKINEKKR